MLTFSNDTDILKYEPALFGEFHLPAEALAAGWGGRLEGTKFTAAGADFIKRGVTEQGVIWLRSEDGVLDGPYEIVTVLSDTEVKVSVVRPGPLHESVGPPPATKVSFYVATFATWAAQVTEALSEYLGIRPGTSDSSVEPGALAFSQSLRKAAVFGVISKVYDILYTNEPRAVFWKKSIHYRALFVTAKEQCRKALPLTWPLGEGRV